jgi:hypothetical protein
MEQMFKMMDEMIDKMCSEDRMKLMKQCLDKCMSGMSPEETAEAMKGVFPGGSPKNGAWDKMPDMVMSMMGMMCVRMMNDMMKGGSGGGGGSMGGGPMAGMMGGGGPMKMMQKMMQNFGAQKAEEPSQGKAEEPSQCKTEGTSESTGKDGDSG